MSNCKYKDTGIKWIGKVPEHWELHKLKHCLQLINNKTYPNSTLVYIGMENIESWSGKYVETSIETDGIANVFQKGNILFGKLRPYLAKVHLAEFDGCCSSELLVYHSKNQNINYLQKLLITKGFIDLINASTYGSKMPRAKSSFIGNQLLPIPPLSEQLSIVRFLEKETANIDVYIKQREQEIAALAELKQAEIAAAVTRGLNPNAKMKPSGIAWIGDVPEHWEIDKLGQHFVQRKAKVSDKDYSPLSVSKMGVTPQLETAVKTDNGENRKLVKAGDFVVNSRSDRKGSCGFSKLDGSVSLINIVLTPINVLSDYYHFLFRSNNYVEEFYRLGRGIVADLWTTRWTEMRSIMIPIPPITEQQQIVTHIEQRVRQFDDYAVVLKSEIEQMLEYKQRLISDAVTGKIKIKN
jgi:type I restriction enzyme S subunit